MVVTGTESFNEFVKLHGSVTDFANGRKRANDAHPHEPNAPRKLALLFNQQSASGGPWTEEDIAQFDLPTDRPGVRPS